MRRPHKSSLPILAVVGPSGVGKTTLLEALTKEMTARGYRVAAVKHSHHQGLLSDTPGKDSYRLWQAGAHVIVLTGPGVLIFRGPPHQEWLLSQIVPLLHGKADVVLLEGYRAQKVPRIEVWRREFPPPPWPPAGDVIAVVGDRPQGWDGPSFSFPQVQELASFLENRLGLKAP